MLLIGALRDNGSGAMRDRAKTADLVEKISDHVEVDSWDDINGQR